jgi:AcrR family transcriptional regulator
MTESTPTLPNEQSLPASGASAHAGPERESDLARQRREEIASAATEIISTEGIHKLSLARIEQKLGMSRGQLTYYYPTKESILLAVFDKMLERMVAEAIADGARHGMGLPGDTQAQRRLYFGIEKMLFNTEPENAELLSLVHTFMAQIRHRDDFRTKIALAHQGWRYHLTDDLLPAMAHSETTIAPEIAASFIMALFQGLGSQLAVDPQAFDRQAMMAACRQLLAPLFEKKNTPQVNHE